MGATSDKKCINFAKQEVTLGGLGSLTFLRTIVVTKRVYMFFEWHFQEGQLDPLDVVKDGGTTLKVSNRYMTVRATPKPASSMAHSTVTRALALWAHT